MPKQLSILRILLLPWKTLTSRGRSRWLLAIGVGLLLTGAAFAALFVWLVTQPPGRVANETLKLPWSLPSETAWTTENAYPHLTFFEPTCVAFAKDGSGRVFVLERRGTVQMLQDSADTSDYVQVLDVSTHTWRTPYEDDGAVAIALHPEFGQEGSPNANYLYLLYTAKVDEVRYNRLSRFTLNGNKASDEFVLIEQLNENLWHNGGGLAFGPDGFLYIGMGDEGTNGDGLENGQRLNRDLYCGILRIDVDQRGGEISHAPPRQPDTGKTQGYFIPSDNPFVNQAGLLEEFWAHGLRNPFRIAFDPADGTLWAADVGHLRREEVNIIQRGGNYGWSYREGSLSFDESYLKGNPPTPAYGETIDPVWEYPHLNSNNCVIGGFVYRDGKHADLEGKFIYADNGSGRVWALSVEDGKATANEELLSLPVSSKTGIASVQPDAHGEPLIVILGETGTTSGTIRRVVPAEDDAGSSLPATLTATGIFADLATLSPNPGVIPYEVNAPKSAGAARIRHWISVPGDGQDPDATTDRIGFQIDDAWTFPTGTVFVQHFDLPVASEGNNKWRPVETRVLVRHNGQGVYGLSYRWNDEGTEAHLVNEPASSSFEIDDAHGGGTQSWQFFDRQSCLACHNANAGYILGVNTKQLNYPSLGEQLHAENQLTDLASREYFDKPLDVAALAKTQTLINPHDDDVDLSHRARSYLDVNCAACHREGGARANYFAELHRTEQLATLAVKPLQGDFGIADAKVVSPGDPHRSVLYYRMAKLGQGRMPFVGAHELDRQGLELIRRWIEHVDAADDEIAQAQDEAIAQLLTTSNASNTAEHQHAIDQLLSDTRGAFVLWQAVYDDSIGEPLRGEIIATAIAHPSPNTRDLFEWFVDPRERTSRLGLNFDPIVVLQHEGDIERGRQLFDSAALLTCNKCHSTNEGQNLIGPTLWGVGKRFDRRELLAHITDPSQQIDEKFATWMVETATGKVYHGVIVQRDDEHVVLRDAQGTEHSIATEDIDWLERQPQSLMPDNLLQGLTPVQAADLLAYLKSLK